MCRKERHGKGHLTIGMIQSQEIEKVVVWFYLIVQLFCFVEISGNGKKTGDESCNVFNSPLG